MRRSNNPKKIVMTEKNDIYLSSLFPVVSAILITVVNILTNHIDPQEQYDWRFFSSQFWANEIQL